MGRYIGNDIVVRCKFNELLTDNADDNVERNSKKYLNIINIILRTCRDYNHQPKLKNKTGIDSNSSMEFKSPFNTVKA
jgi:hypothetical protein